MSATRKINFISVHYSLDDLMVRLGYRGAGKGVCRGAAFKFLTTAALGEEEKKKYIDRLLFITKHHKEWEIERAKKYKNENTSDSFLIKFTGAPRINTIQFFQETNLIKEVHLNIDKARAFKSIDSKLKKKLNKLKDADDLTEDEKDQIIAAAFTHAKIPRTTPLLDWIKSAKSKELNKEKLTDEEEKALDVLRFCDQYMLYHAPGEYESVFTGYDMHVCESLPADLNHHKDSYIYLSD